MIAVFPIPSAISPKGNTARMSSQYFRMKCLMLCPCSCDFLNKKVRSITNTVMMKMSAIFKPSLILGSLGWIKSSIMMMMSNKMMQSGINFEL